MADPNTPSGPEGNVGMQDNLSAVVIHANGNKTEVLKGSFLAHILDFFTQGAS